MTQFKTSQCFLLALLVAVSAALIVPQLGLRSLWWDEAFSWWFTTIHLRDLWRIAWNQGELNMVLYQALLNVWSFGGDSEFWLRLPSAIFAVATVWVVAMLGRVLFDPRVGLTAALLMALNGFVIVYGEEARAYSMLLFLSTLSSYLVVCALRFGNPGYWASFVVVSVLCGYTHFLGVLQVFAQVSIAAMLVCIASRRIPIRLLAAAGLVLVGMLPLFWYVLTKPSQIDWIPQPTAHTLATILLNLAGGGAMLLILITLGIFGFARRYRDGIPLAGGGSFSPAGYVVLCFLIPIWLVFAISLVRPLTVPRYLIALVAPLVLMGAAGLMAIPHRTLRGAALVVVTILAFRSSLAQLDRGSFDFRSATAYVLEDAAPGDALMFCLPHPKMVFDYYARHASYVPPAVYPAYPRPYKEPVPGQPGALSPGALVSRAAGYDRVWMLCPGDDEDADPGTYDTPLLDAFAQSYAVREVMEFPYVRVVRLDKRE